MSKVTRREWYRRVNAAWPAKVPPLTDDEAIRAARKLYRFERGYMWEGRVEITSGNRYSWIRRGVMYVNPERGWQSLVHLLSHYLAPGKHGADHARCELRMIKEVVRRGWLDGKLKTPEKEPAPEPTVDQIRAAKIQRLDERIKRWTTREKRAKTALAKLRRSKRAYERAAEKAIEAARQEHDAEPSACHMAVASVV